MPSTPPPSVAKSPNAGKDASVFAGAYDVSYHVIKSGARFHRASVILGDGYRGIGGVVVQGDCQTLMDCFQDERFG